MKAAAFLIALAVAGCGHRIRTAADINAEIRAALASHSPIVELPSGQIHLDQAIVIPKGAANLTLRGNRSGSELVLDPAFDDTAAIEADGVTNITISGFLLTGNRTNLTSNWYLPVREEAFADYYTSGGIVIRRSNHVTIRDVSFSRIRAFPVLINSTSQALIDKVTIEDSGTLDRQGHNNTTGGILIEEGSSAFEIRGARISRVTGNAIWTHSYARSPRQSGGLIHDNFITTVARDAIQVGHATGVRVEHNRGSQIGFPVEEIDFGGYGTPVALDTAGNVDHTVYTANGFTSVNGQCIDLDGFHDGEVSGNSCVNPVVESAVLGGAWIGSHFGILFGDHDPGMTSSNVSVTNNTIQGFAYGGVFLIGDHNRIENNRFLDVNLLHCGDQPASVRCNALPKEPDALRSGIYLSDNGGRLTATRDNVIRNNFVMGYGIAQHCITAKPGVELSANTIADNRCENPKDLP